jgi:hypothetical protein
MRVSGSSGFAIGVDRSQGGFRGFLPRKTTPRGLCETRVIAKPVNWRWRWIANCLVIVVALPFGKVATALPLQTLPGQQLEASAAAESPGAGTAKADASQSAAASDSQAAAGSQTNNQPAAAPQAAPQQQQNGNTAPVGTAAAPYEKGVGVAASRPAGAVIAPAKQKRTRSILIKVGLIVAAAVAVGTVVALSSASPSTPH